MVVDVFTYNGETSILKLHLAVLYDYVDKFIIVEANKTFTGAKKPMYFFRDQRYFAPWLKKIEYYPVTDWDDPEIWEMAIKSPNTLGASHWKREFYIKESIKKALINLHDEDLLFIGDVDEIIDPEAYYESETPIKVKMRVYAYQLNNLSSESFYGTLIAQYKDIKDHCLNEMRNNTFFRSKGGYLGWHFTSMGGLDEVRRKLNDSYTQESYNTFEVQQLLPDRYKIGKDYLGRNFIFTLDKSHWPKYLETHEKDFKLMIK